MIGSEQELADASPENKPLRRRVAILIGQWVPQLKAEDRPKVYRAMLDLLADEDFGISMAAVTALIDLVDDWSFEEEPFLEFVAPCFQLLAQRLQACQDYETQIQVSLFALESDLTWRDAPWTVFVRCHWQLLQFGGF